VTAHPSRLVTPAENADFVIWTDHDAKALRQNRRPRQPLKGGRKFIWRRTALPGLQNREECGV